jgi:lipopolysaccharide transport system ATP-binding protein
VSLDALAVERLCDRAVLLRHGSVEFEGSTGDAIAEYRRLLAGERSPDELAAGLREWGSGEARIVSARLLDGDGDVREPAQFASGERAILELAVTSEAGVAAPTVSLELRDHDGLVFGGTSQATEAIGWGEGPGERVLRFEIDRLPLADGHFHLRCALVEAKGGRLLHSLEDAVRFFVFPAGVETGAVLLEGRWSLQEIAASTPIG